MVQKTTWQKHVAQPLSFVPFYSMKIEIMSEKGTKVVQPQREMRILIEKGNTVAWPPCQYFRVWRDLLSTHGFQIKEKMYNTINTIDTFWSIVFIVLYVELLY